MRKLALGMATAAMAIASPALAKDGAVYFGGEFGASLVNDTDIDVGAVEDAIELNYDFDFPDEAGWDGALLLGYDFGGFRIEGEASMKSADIESLTTLVALPGAPPLGTEIPAVGNTDVTAFMLNAMADFGDDDGIQAFVGAGAGWAKVDLDSFGAYSNQAAFLDDDDSGFAWQIFAGLRQAISDSVDMHVKYRYFNTSSISLDEGVNQGDMNYGSHSLLGGITFNFGGDAPPPPPPPPPPRAAPPPPPPPPPAPQTRVCPNGQTLPVTTPCPAPPPPQVPPTGERG